MAKEVEIIFDGFKFRLVKWKSEDESYYTIGTDYELLDPTLGSDLTDEQRTDRINNIVSTFSVGSFDYADDQLAIFRYENRNDAEAALQLALLKWGD